MTNYPTARQPCVTVMLGSADGAFTIVRIGPGGLRHAVVAASKGSGTAG